MEHELREEIDVNLNSVISLVWPIEEFFKTFGAEISCTNVVLSFGDYCVHNTIIVTLLCAPKFIKLCIM